MRSTTTFKQFHRTVTYTLCDAAEALAFAVLCVPCERHRYLGTLRNGRKYCVLCGKLHHASV